MLTLKTVAKTAVVVAGVALAALGLTHTAIGGEGVLPVALPKPALDESAKTDVQTAIFAGGCFWGVQGVFQHVKGVKSAISGYAGGSMENPTYEDVVTEPPGHAESVKVTYDPSQVTYGQLLQIFFSVTTDPTTLNQQGNDVGPSYRSALFTMNDEQAKVASAYIAQLDAAKVYPSKIVTEVTPYTNFFVAEDYHQDNATTLNVNPGYVTFFDLPKIADLKTFFPDVWLETPTLVFPKA